MTSLDLFLKDMQALIDRKPTVDQILTDGRTLIADAIKRPDIVPAEYRVTSGKRANHGTYNVYRGANLFVSVSVWGPGDRADPHNHNTWGLIGVVENSIQETRYRVKGRDNEGLPVVERVHIRLLKEGDVALLKNGEDEIHELDNFSDRNTVELHVYGTNLIGLDRYAFDRATGHAKPFRSGKYDNC